MPSLPQLRQQQRLKVIARLRQVLSGGFIKHVMTLAGGAAIAQFLPLLVSPILTRLYTPADFGLLAIYVAWMSSLAVLATGRYELAIVLPKSEPEAGALMNLSLCITLGLALLCLVIVWPLHDRLAEKAQAHALGTWLFALPLSILLAGGMQAWTNWNNRHRRYQANALGRIAQTSGLSLVQLGLGYLQFGAIGLLIGQLVGQLAALFAQTLEDVKTRFRDWSPISFQSIQAVAVRYSEFPKVNAPHAFLGALQDTLTVTLLGALSGSLTVGLFGLMMRVLKLPAALIGQAVAQVAYREMAEAKNQNLPLSPLLKKLLGVLFAMALVPFLVIQLWGESLFALVFGEAWRMAGSFAQALALYILFHFVASPLGMVPLVIERQRTAFFFTLVSSVIFLGSIWGGYLLTDSMQSAFWITSVAMSVYFISYFIWLFKAVKQCEA